MSVTQLCCAGLPVAILLASNVIPATDQSKPAPPQPPLVHAEPAAMPDAFVTFDRADDSIAVSVNGKPFTTFHFEHGAQKPYFYPVLGPNGEHVTRGWPIADGRVNEAHDHPHHVSLWYAHGNVNGHDFWHGPGGERIICFDVSTTKVADHEILMSIHQWNTKDGSIILTERRTVHFDENEFGRIMTFDIELIASEGPITFGDTKEGTFAMRLAPTLRLKGEVAAGHAINSEGVKDGEVWGKRAAWVEYHGPIGDDGRLVTVAILDHPENPRHPTWWHARDYGLFAANPFGIHDFEGKPAGTGDFQVESGESIRFRYQVIIHEGKMSADDIDHAMSHFKEGLEHSH